MKTPQKTTQQIDKKTEISDLSAHLFWDVDSTKLSFERNKALIIQRVLEYGVLADWKIAVSYYGMDRLLEVAKDLRELDDISLNFIVTITDTPKEEFRCFTMK